MTNYRMNLTPWRDQGGIELLHFDVHGDTYARKGALIPKIIDLLHKAPITGAAESVRNIQKRLRTSHVQKVATLQRDACEDPPQVGMRWKGDFMHKVVRRPEGVVVLPDLPAIFRSTIESAAKTELPPSSNS